MPVSVTCEALEPPEAGPDADERAIVEAALSAPVGAPPLEVLARGRERVTIVVPDRTRPARTPVVARRGARAPRDGRRPAGARAACWSGAGSTSPPTPEEAEAIVGPDVAGTLEVLSSEPDEPSAYEFLAPDSALGRPRVHRAVAEADLVVLTGAIAPHYLAGFSGGAQGPGPRLRRSHDRGGGAPPHPRRDGGPGRRRAVAARAARRATRSGASSCASRRPWARPGSSTSASPRAASRTRSPATWRRRTRPGPGPTRGASRASGPRPPTW